jgi:hypothetical protein
VVVHSSTRVWKVCRFSQPWDAWFITKLRSCCRRTVIGEFGAATGGL